MQSFSLSYDYDVPARNVFNALADPGFIHQIAPFKVTVSHLNDGEDHKYGAGSIRRIKPWFGTSYDEKIVTFDPPRLIEYTAIRGTPFNHHFGRYIVEELAEGSRFIFELEFDCRLPGLAYLMYLLLEPINRRGFDKLHKIISTLEY